MKTLTGVGIQKRSITILVGAIVLLGLLLIRVAWIQVINGEEYSKNAALQQTKDIVISSKRGTIYDRNMNELAKSASSETVTVSPREIKESGKINDIASGLAAILKMDKDKVYATLAKDSSYEVVKRKIDKDQADAIRKESYPGVVLVEDFKRYYPGGTLASHVIGFVGTDNQGLAGIEMIYENYLKGLPGRIITAKNAAGSDMPYKYEKYIDPQNGVNIVLTIDEVIQRKAEDSLQKAVEKYNVQNGAACIIMGAKTGEVLAMATYPTFDLNTPFTIMNEEKKAQIEQIENEKQRSQATSDELNRQWRNKAVVDSYEPGSTFKAMVAAMALEENLVNLNENFVCSGSVQVANYNIGCWNRSGHGTETFVQGVYNSCNPVFMSIGSRLGATNFYKYYKSFGFGSTTGFDLPGEAPGVFHSMDRFNEVELATASFGQGFTVTPLQLVTAYSAITNDGYMVKPRLIKSLVDDDGNVIENFEPEKIRQVVSKETADTVCQILEGVASDGTSKNAYIEGYHIAGKTGTSEKTPRGNGKYVASFVGFAPADDPELICLIMLDEPMGSSYMGGAIAAPTFKEIMSDVLVYMQIKSDSSPKYNFVPNITGQTLEEAKNSLTAAGFKSVVMGEGTSVVSQSPAVGTALGDNAIVVVYTEPVAEDYVVVPDLNGYYASDANQLLVNAGLNIKVGGAYMVSSSVLVGTQDPPAGTEVPRGSVVTVEYNYTTNVH
ncbi:MAG: PASTA domain-containing protein [Ruminococcaceae bacterium]|nr:PASTA domain-containing protein [Oscillospiraceae bacterium]